jgi:predicted TIM-barrel fold metal-dependent hydrolase
VHVEAPEVAVEWARTINDAFARVVRERSGRFSALATLPLNDPATSTIELERALTDLGLALDFAGEDRILAGSDYPDRIGSIPLMLDTLRTLDVPDRVREKILGGNAPKVLAL